MRIGLIVYGSPNQHSGGYLYDRKLVQALRKRGHRVAILSLPAGNYFQQLLQNFSNGLIEKILLGKFDVLLEDELNHPSLFLLNERIKKSTGAPIISVVHHLRSSEQHSPLINWFYRLVEKKYLSSVDAFVFNSATTKKVVSNLIGRKGHHIVANPGADRLRPRISPATVRVRARHVGPVRIAFVGSLTRRKAPHLILEAMAKLPVGILQVDFAGDASAEPGYANYLRDLTRKLGLSRQVWFLGHLAEPRLAQLLSRSDVLVIPSSYEGFGIAFLEGMGFGLPAIGTHSGAAGELIANGVNGYLIALGDSSELTGRLKALATDRRLLARLSLAARRRYERAATWQESMNCIIEFLSFYNKASSTKRRPV